MFKLIIMFYAIMFQRCMILMVLTGGPFKDFKWGGQTLRPTKDGEAEYQKGKTQFERDASPNGDSYATGEAVVGFVQQECAFTPTEFSELEALQDGAERSGTATAQNGDVISMNGSIDGELTLVGGKATVKIAGKVNVQ